MQSVKENKAELAIVLAKVKDHCMCLRFNEDARFYLIYYPLGYQLDGVRCSKGMGKIAALNKILEVMEKHWKESFI